MAPLLAPAELADGHLPQCHYDLVLAHFILAYVSQQALLELAARLLLPCAPCLCFSPHSTVLRQC